MAVATRSDASGLQFAPSWPRAVCADRQRHSEHLRHEATSGMGHSLSEIGLGSHSFRQPFCFALRK
jgi:hypothetical protein